jgi:hypothetical protein
MRKYLILCVMLWVLAMSGAAWATEYFVNPECSSGCDGTSWAKGWSSFARINWTTLNTGGPNTLYIAGGNYTSPLAIDHTSSNRLYIRPGSASSSPSGYDGLVTIRGLALGSSSVIHTVGSGTRNMKISPVTGKGVYGRDASSKTDSGLQIIYLEIDGSAQGSSCQLHAIEIPQQLCNVEIAYNYIHDMRGNATFQSYNPKVATFAEAGTFHHNTVKNNYGDHFVPDWFGGWDVYDNEFSGLGNYGNTPGCHADGIAGPVMWMRVFNNTFHDSTQEVFISGQGTAHHYYIYNNIFYSNQIGGWTEPGIMLYWARGAGTFENLRIVNNNFYNMNVGAIISTHGGHNLHITNTIIANNIFFPNKLNFMISEPAQYSNTEIKFYRNVFQGSLSASWHGTFYRDISSWNSVTGAKGENANFLCTPLVVNLSGHDFHLQSRDICAVDKGIDLSTFGWTDMGSGWGKDKDGNPRPQGSGWDIGAYELVKSPPPPTRDVPASAPHAEK